MVRKRYGGGQTWRYFPTWSVRSRPGYKYEDMIHIIEYFKDNVACIKAALGQLVDWLVGSLDPIGSRTAWMVDLSIHLNSPTRRAVRQG